jgi:hypothetical protein
MFDRQDERRRRVYAPLFDELERLKKLLEGFHAIPPAARGYGELKEYEKIVDDHILFLVPKKLRADIRRLYDDLLKQFDKQLKLAKDKLEDSVLNDLVASGPAGAGIDSRAKQLGMMGRFVLSKQLPKEDWKPKMDAAFQDLKASGWKRLGSYASLDEMFEDQIARCDTNPIQEIVTLREIRTKCVDLLGRIRKEIGKDLGVE